MTLSELEACDELSPCEYLDYIDKEDIPKFHAKYKTTVVTTSRPNTNDRPNGSYAFRFD